jgi:hypothetical protein
MKTVPTTVALLTAATTIITNPDDLDFTLTQLTEIINGPWTQHTPKEQTDILVTILGAFTGYALAVTRLGVPPHTLTRTIQQFALDMETLEQ